MDFDVQIVEHHPVLEVAVKPVGLLDQQDPNRRALPKVGDHVGEADTARLFGRLDVNVLLLQPKAVHGSVVAQQLELRRDREAFLLPLLGRDAGVEHGGWAWRAAGE